LGLALVFLSAVALAFTMGNTSSDASSFDNTRTADRSIFHLTLPAARVFNLAKLLLVAAIDMAGLAIGFSGFDRNCDGCRWFQAMCCTEGNAALPALASLRRIAVTSMQGLRKP